MTRAIRVTQLFCRLDPDAGGLLTFLAAQTAALRGTPVELRTSAVSSSSTVDPHSPLGAWRLRRWLSGQIRQTDVVHIHHIFGWHALIGARACRKAGKPFVLSTHGGIYQNALAAKSIRKQLFLSIAGTEILRGAHSILVTSDAEAAEVRSLDSSLPIELIMPGIDVPDRPLARFHNHAKAGLRMIYLGRLHPHKDLETAIRATALLRQSGIDAVLTLLGSGEQAYVERLRKEANQLDLSQYVRFAGHVSGDEKLDWMREADIMVLPSRSENFSFAVAEAMALGIPALVSTQVGLAPAIRRHQCGDTFEVGDAEALAARTRSYTDLNRRREAGRRAHRCAAEMLSLAQMGERLLQVYGAALPHARPPAEVLRTDG